MTLLYQTALQKRDCSWLQPAGGGCSAGTEETSLLEPLSFVATPLDVLAPSEFPFGMDTSACGPTQTSGLASAIVRGVGVKRTCRVHVQIVCL